jgi:hypothetical protein
MQSGQIMRFRTIEELQSSLQQYLDELKKKTEEYSKLIGEKIRGAQTTNPEELADLKTKLEGPADPKKKKPVKKKNGKTNWLDYGAIAVYDGLGTKGELELYFKAIEELKIEIEKVQKTKESVDSLVTKGLKKEIGCVALMNHELPFEVNFINLGQPRPKFSFKGIFHVKAEETNEIKN